jgi:hypothetical protein
MINQGLNRSPGLLKKSAERCTSLQKVVHFCRNLRFLQKSKISAESVPLSAEICKNIKFLQKGAHLSAEI